MVGCARRGRLNCHGVNHLTIVIEDGLAVPYGATRRLPSCSASPAVYRSYLSQHAAIPGSVRTGAGVKPAATMLIIGKLRIPAWDPSLSLGDRRVGPRRRCDLFHWRPERVLILAVLGRKLCVTELTMGLGNPVRSTPQTHDTPKTSGQVVAATSGITSAQTLTEPRETKILQLTIHSGLDPTI